MERLSSPVMALSMAVVWQEPAVAHREAVSQGRQAKAPSLPPQTTLLRVVSSTEASEDSSQELAPVVWIIKAQLLLSCACMHVFLHINMNLRHRKDAQEYFDMFPDTS